MKPENFRLKMSIKIRRNWHGVKINSSEKIDKNTIIINLIADMNKWHSFNALRSAIELSVVAITKDRQVITKIHEKGFVINKYTDNERIILPVLFINQESD
jgi:hypothetical protein